MIITVQSKELPQAGKKQGIVTDTSGKRWGVWADKILNYVEGQSYEITFKTWVSPQGVTFFTIQSALPVAAGAAVSQQGLMQQPAPRSAMAAMGHPPNDDQRRMDIFVCGAFNNIMGNPNILPDLPLADMTAIIVRLIAAWKATLGPKADPISSGVEQVQKNSDMNDEIPF